MLKPRIVKLRSGFLAFTVPGSECLNRDGQPIGAEFDEYATMPTDAQRETPLAELFAHVPQEPLAVEERYWLDDQGRRIPIDDDEHRRIMDAIYASEEA